MTRPMLTAILLLFAAGLSASAKEPDVAKSLIRFMTAPSAAATLRAKGVDPI